MRTLNSMSARYSEALGMREIVATENSVVLGRPGALLEMRLRRGNRNHLILTLDVGDARWPGPVRRIQSREGVTFTTGTFPGRWVASIPSACGDDVVDTVFNELSKEVASCGS